jgi:HD superfamily phosphohydrolase
MSSIKRSGACLIETTTGEHDAKRAKLNGSTPTERPELLQETFTPNDPVHGLIHLPKLVKHIVDTHVFQRMRHIKQLGVCALVYPGATHNRFFHSIGTAYLAYEFVKDLRWRQPELEVSDRDLLCVTLAALCHDLGHPCFSHMFEHFVHATGKDMRLEAEHKAQTTGQRMDADTERRIERLETWTHEDASVRLLEIIFKDKSEVLKEAGLCCDAEGDDFACIRELIDPPKKKLEALLESGGLRTEWSKHIKGRPVEKAWLYEIVSNWRSGIDVDKFDYFRRDALYLGIKKEFDHHRFMKAVRVLPDGDGVRTISPPDKEKDSLRENMLELRKSLHRSAYQHKTVKKIEMHMIDILKMMDKHIRIKGTDGKKFSMSEAAEQLDPIAYQKLTDSFIETKLEEHEVEALRPAEEEYDQRIIKRNLMRLVADWNVERDMSEMVPLDKDVIIDGVLAAYQQYGICKEPGEDLVMVKREELRCEVCFFHYGMKFKDPITRVLFHSSKDVRLTSPLSDIDGRPMRQKVVFFWNPSDRPPSHNLTLSRLSLAFKKWADQQSHQTEKGSKTEKLMSPNRLSAPSEDSLGMDDRQNSPPPRVKSRRVLSIKSSAIDQDVDDAVMALHRNGADQQSHQTEKSAKTEKLMSPNRVPPSEDSLGMDDRQNSPPPRVKSRRVLSIKSSAIDQDVDDAVMALHRTGA